MVNFDREDGKNVSKTRFNSSFMYKFFKKKTSSKIYYSGQAYRRSSSTKGSAINFINDQLGIEILGSKNQIQDDFKVISTILSSVKKIKMKKIQIKVGDISLFKV